MTNNGLTDYIASRPVTLTSGKHNSPERGMCILELCSLALGIEWTDSPDILGLPDIRRMNDAKWCDDETRTREMLRLGVAIWPWRTATDEQRFLFVSRLAELTIRRVLPPMLRNAGLNVEADRCESEGTENSAYIVRSAVTAAAVAHSATIAYIVRAAASAAYAASAASATTRAAAARAAAYAAAAASNAGSKDILIIAIDCWVEAAAELTEKHAGK